MGTDGSVLLGKVFRFPPEVWTVVHDTRILFSSNGKGTHFIHDHSANGSMKMAGHRMPRRFRRIIFMELLGMLIILV